MEDYQNMTNDNETSRKLIYLSLNCEISSSFYCLFCIFACITQILESPERKKEKVEENGIKALIFFMDFTFLWEWGINFISDVHIFISRKVVYRFTKLSFSPIKKALVEGKVRQHKLKFTTSPSPSPFVLDKIATSIMEDARKLFKSPHKKGTKNFFPSTFA